MRRPYICIKNTSTSFMKTYKPLLIAVLLLFGATAFAQRTITGRVVDNIGEPVPFATVGVVGTTVGTTTDFDGNFSLTVPADAQRISVSFMGFESRIIELGTTSVFSVVLESQMTQLDEVVVIGFGTTTRRNLTASVVSVSADALRDNPVTQVADALTGRFAGVQVSTSEGSPDAEITIRVRGGGSITQSSSPLFIVDGFPVESISDISPSEIATIDVLKDASATAIYGARGANGVVIITTRSGQEGRITASYNFFATVQNMARRLPVLSPYEFALWQHELALMRGDGLRTHSTYHSNYVRFFGLFEDMDLYRNVRGNDWQDIVFGTSGHIFNHSLNVSGGNPFARFNATYNRINNQAIMMGSYFQRDNLNFRTTWNPLQGLSIDFTTRYSRTHTRGSGANDQGGSATDARMRHVMVFSPVPLRNLDAGEEDEDAAIGGLHATPTVSIADNDRRRLQERLSIQGAVTYELLPGLRLRTEFGIDNTTTTDDRFFGLSTFISRQNAVITGLPISTWQTFNRRTMRNTNTINWRLDERMPGDHHFDVLLGQEIIMTQSNTASMRGEGFPEFFTAEQAWNFMTYRPGATAPGATVIGNVFHTHDNLASFFGRANWRLGGTYLASLTVRTDGSSRFAPGNQWGVFPSASVGWRLSDEPFMQTILPSSLVDNVMIRASLGMAGNNDIPSGQIERLIMSGTTSYISTGTAIFQPGNIMPNPDLTWETMVTRNVGLAFNLFNWRLGGTVDFYQNDTRDLLVRFPMGGTGYQFQYQNIGSTRNRGVDIALDGRLVQTRNFHLDANFNIGFNQNRVTSLGDLTEIAAASGWHSDITQDFVVRVGQSLGLMWGFVHDGRYSAYDFTRVGGDWVLNEGVVGSDITGHILQPGAIRFKDINGDGVVDADDMTIIGNATPRFTGGFGFSGRWHGFDFSAHFSFVVGNDIYNANRIDWETTTGDHSHRNMLATMDRNGRYTFIDANGTFVTDPSQLEAMNAHHSNFSPRTGRAIFSSFAVEDGSFLRANNITIGYTVPREITRRAGMQTLRFFATVNNAFILTNYSGFDPEVNTRRATPLTPGVDFSAFPRSRGYTFGVNVTF